MCAHAQIVWNPEGTIRPGPIEEQFRSMIKENLVAERIAIESYREMIAYLGGRDPSTQRMLEAILASEEEHADDLSSLLEGIKD